MHVNAQVTYVMYDVVVCYMKLTGAWISKISKNMLFIMYSCRWITFEVA